jgi:hypothetical protein
VLATAFDGKPGLMFICPYDLDPCEGARCASGVCERSHQPCLIACLDCAELYEVGAGALRLCAGCVSAEARQTKEG